MSLVKNKDSKIEKSFRKELWGKGYRYRKNSRKYFGAPDIVLAKYKTVIFIDSCFWHGCKIHKSIPEDNKQFWIEKIRRNKQRDGEVNSCYKNMNWHIFRIWEHDMSNKVKIVNNIKKQIDKLYPEVEKNLI